MVEKFTLVLEDFLGIKRTLLNIEERWNACPPVEAGGQSIRDYISKVSHVRGPMQQHTLTSLDRLLPLLLRWFPRILGVPPGV